jgi:DNA-binding IscR family transcriptional regulator
MTRRGPRAGSQLKRAPHSIGLDAVYRAVGPSASFVLHAQKPDEHCRVGRNIERVLGAVFSSAHSALEEALAKRNLADVLETLAHDSGTPAMQAGVLV